MPGRRTSSLNWEPKSEMSRSLSGNASVTGALSSSSFAPQRVNSSTIAAVKRGNCAA